MVAAAVAALLLAGCSAPGRISVPWLHLALGGSPSSSASPPQAAATPSGPQLTIGQFVPIAEKFVEQHRGLTFKTPVRVTLLGDAAFRERLLGHEDDTAAIETTSKDLLALHLIDKGVDLGAAARDLLGAGVSGFYDPKTKSLVVRGVAATPYVRQVLVHELTHAVQDQYFGIDRPDLDKADDERGVAFQTVVEGDAVRIENEYHDSLSPAEQAEADSEEQAQGGGVPSGIPPVLVELVAFPYIAGPHFMTQLDQIGGQAKVDDAFVHPPVSTAQVLQINRYLDGEQPRSVARPRADGTVYDHGVLGEFGLLLLLEGPAGMSTSEASQVALLWGGDQYVAWTKGSQACIRTVILPDSAAQLSPLRDALQSYARAVDGTVSSAGSAGPVTVTSCG